MAIEEFLNKARRTPEAAEFAEAIALIDSAYTFQPCAFINGALVNEAGQK